MLHEEFLKETNSTMTSENSTETEQKVTDSGEVARGVVQDQAVAGPSQKVEETAARRDDLLPSTMIGIATVSEIKKLQSADPDIGPILQSKVSGVRPSSNEMMTKSPACRHYWVLWDALVLQEGILFKRFPKKDATGNYIQLLIPSALKREILCQMHNFLLAGHLGCKKMKQKIQQRHYWYALKEDVNLHILKCDVCQADKKSAKVPRASLGSLPSGAPGDCLATDYVRPLPVTPRGNMYILLLTDHFSKYVKSFQFRT